MNLLETMITDIGVLLVKISYTKADVIEFRNIIVRLLKINFSR